MLVLGRHPGEYIVLRDRKTKELIATVFLTDIYNRSKARIGIEADDFIEIVRSELMEKEKAKA